MIENHPPKRCARGGGRREVWGAVAQRCGHRCQFAPPEQQSAAAAGRARTQARVCRVRDARKARQRQTQRQRLAAPVLTPTPTPAQRPPRPPQHPPTPPPCKRALTNSKQKTPACASASTGPARPAGRARERVHDLPRGCAGAESAVCVVGKSSHRAYCCGLRPSSPSRCASCTPSREIVNTLLSRIHRLLIPTAMSTYVIPAPR